MGLKYLHIEYGGPPVRVDRRVCLSGRGAVQHRGVGNKRVGLLVVCIAKPNNIEGCAVIWVVGLRVIVTTNPARESFQRPKSHGIGNVVVSLQLLRVTLPIFLRCPGACSLPLL